MTGFRIEKPVLQPDIREQTEEEVKETFHLAFRDLIDRLPLVEVVHEVMKQLPLEKLKTVLSNLRKGKYEL
jgi:hypothetical protein